MSKSADTGCTFTDDRDVYCPPATSAYYRHRKTLQGWLKFEGMEFHAFVGHMIRVANNCGDHYLVDQWGGVWAMRGRKDIHSIDMNPRPVRDDAKRGYALGLWAVAYAKV